MDKSLGAREQMISSSDGPVSDSDSSVTPVDPGPAAPVASALASPAIHQIRDRATPSTLPLSAQVPTAVLQEMLFNTNCRCHYDLHKSSRGHTAAKSRSMKSGAMRCT